MLEKLGNLGEFIAAIGVIVSLVYLAIQMRQATNVARVDAHQRINEQLFGALFDIAKDSELHSIYRRGIWLNEPLDESEQDRLGMFLYRAFGTYSTAFYAAQVDPELESLSQTGLDAFIRQPRVREWWDRHRTNFLVEFREFVDAKVKAIEESNNEVS